MQDNNHPESRTQLPEVAGPSVSTKALTAPDPITIALHDAYVTDDDPLLFVGAPRHRTSREEIEMITRALRRRQEFAEIMRLQGLARITAREHGMGIYWSGYRKSSLAEAFTNDLKRLDHLFARLRTWAVHRGLDLDALAVAGVFFAWALIAIVWNARQLTFNLW